MKSNKLLAVILVLVIVTSPVYAHKLSLKDKLKNMFSINNTKSSTSESKTITNGAACSPDTPKNCDTKK